VNAEFACSEMDALLAEGASGAVASGDRARLDAHLGRCERCRAELARYEDVFAVLREGPAGLLADGAAPDLAPPTLRRWMRSRRRRALGLAAGSGALAAAAVVALALSPGLHGRQPVGAASRGELASASWEPDIDGALEASGLQRDPGQVQEEDASAVDVVLAAFDDADGT
jgi:anti-sigma factor RsiW